MPRIAFTSRKALVASTLAGLGLIGGSLLGPARPEPSMPPVSLPAWLAEPTAPPDPVTATPEQIALFFEHLTTAEAAGLTTRYPEIVGNLDGAPVALRYAANQARRPSEASGRQTLLYDDRGDGRIAEVLGDLETADHIVILIPGSDNELPEFATGHGGVQRRAPAWQARQLFDRIHAIAPSAQVAVIAWLGYDSPEGLDINAVREDRAASGADSLQRFMDGLVLDAPHRSIVVIGHSYGSTVAGLAVPRLSGQVTDLISVGSPGMGVSSSSDLGTSARVWSCAAPGDWIRRVPGMRLLGLGHGRLPSDPGFGAHQLPCDDVQGHDGYFDPNASALPAMAAIAIGQASEGPPLNSRASTDQTYERLALAGAPSGVGRAVTTGGGATDQATDGAGIGLPSSGEPQ
ncbi:alpha/beta hydrolase [Actinoplanes sichuanensis]|uniref:Alpha/beta hydrolase n=1 Tax=Actinoplanes sichuanensis TaxID=512349 RepID=A0ABW4ATV9_9ACTN|nr:alpha/beta hydrolase [Actinoplanes sichuanensis]